MKVVCDNCRAVYKIPDAKLSKPVNKATCRTCGHRMLIPKPKPGADPEERTLVTAVPPTPMPASPRAEAPGGRMRGDGPATAPMEQEEPEQTLPGRPAGPSYGARHEDVRSMPETPPPPRSRSREPSMATTVTSPPPPEPMPAPMPMQQAQQAQRPRRDHPPGFTPAPAPPREADAFDPSSDLAWAMVGTLVALFGASLQSLQAILASVVADQWLRIILSGFGLMLALAGSMTTLLILLTGGRGTRPARTFLSILFSGGFAVVLSGLGASSSLAAFYLMQEAENINFDGGAIARAPVPAPVAPVPTEPSLADVNGGNTTAAAGNDGVADAAPAPRPAPGGTSSPAPAPQPAPAPMPEPMAATPGPTPSPVAPAPTPTPVPVAAPAPPPPPPAPPPAAGVPMDVVEVMLYNNLGVKKCFVPMFKAGNVPPRVDVRFTIEPTGAVSAASIQQADLKGGDFESCMSTAVRGVSFPPFQGGPQTLTFPFVLR